MSAMVTRKRQLLLAVVAVSATGTVLPACGNEPVCHGFTANAAGCGAQGFPIDAGVGDGSPDDGSAPDAHVANDAHSD